MGGALQCVAARPVWSTLSLEESTGGMLGQCLASLSDDAWVAAQTCREFRAAARSAFPRGLVTRAAGVVSSVERLELAIVCGCTLSSALLGHTAAASGRVDVIGAVARESERRDHTRHTQHLGLTGVARWQPRRVVALEHLSRFSNKESAAITVRIAFHPGALGFGTWRVERADPTSVHIEIPPGFDVLAGLRPFGDCRLELQMGHLCLPLVPEYLPRCLNSYRLKLVLKLPPAEYGIEFIGWSLSSQDRAEMSGVAVQSGPFVFNGGYAAYYDKETGLHDYKRYA